MKRNWITEELIEHFTVLPEEKNIFISKNRHTRLDFAVLFKFFFQCEGRFPDNNQEIQTNIVHYIARQLDISTDKYFDHDLYLVAAMLTLPLPGGDIAPNYLVGQGYLLWLNRKPSLGGAIQLLRICDAMHVITVMGTPQILLLTLSVIIVGIAIMVGVSAFHSYADQASKDQLILELKQLIFDAQTYCKKPKYLGGGRGSFDGFKIPSVYLNSEYGTFEQINLDHPKDHIHFRATGNVIGKDGVNPIVIEVRIEVSKVTFNEKN